MALYDEVDTAEVAPQRKYLGSWSAAAALNVAEDIKAGKHDGWTFSHFGVDGDKLGVAIVHRSGVYALVCDDRELAVKVREFQMVDSYIATQVAAQVAAAAPALPKTTPILQAVPTASEALS